MYGFEVDELIEATGEIGTAGKISWFSNASTVLVSEAKSSGLGPRVCLGGGESPVGDESGVSCV